MTRHNVLDLAKQGNPGAIAQLITDAVRELGIAAKASVKGDCLGILLEAAEIPDRQLIRLVYRGIQSLDLQFIKTIKVYGRGLGQDMPAWSYTLALPERSPATPITPAQSPASPVLEPASDAAAAPEVGPASVAEPAPIAVDKVGDRSDSESRDKPQRHAAPRLRGERQGLTRCSRLLLVLFGMRVLFNGLSLLTSLVQALSYSIYTGVELTELIRQVANGLYVVSQGMDRLSQLLNQVSTGVDLVTILLTLLWLYSLHVALSKRFNRYPIRPWGAIACYILPGYNLWGIWRLLNTLASYLTAQSGESGRQGKALHRLVPWLYGAILTTTALKLYYRLQEYIPLGAPLSPWFFVASDGAVLWLAWAWLQALRRISRALSAIE